MGQTILRSSRKPISKSLRFEIFKRDGFACGYCGGHPPGAILHIDHIHPVVEGGDNNPDNLVTACRECNLGKGAKLLSDVPKGLVDKAAEIAEREEQLRGYQEIMEARKNRIESEAWDVVAILDSRALSEGYRKDWMLSIKRFVEQLGVHEVLDAAEAAVAKRPWSKNQAFRYFCGICWCKIRGANNG